MVRSPFGPPKYCNPNGAVVDRRVWVTSHVPANIGKGRYVLSIPALLKSADVVEDEEAAKAEDGEGNVKIASSSRRRAIVFLLLVLLLLLVHHLLLILLLHQLIILIFIVMFFALFTLLFLLLLAHLVILVI